MLFKKNPTTIEVLQEQVEYLKKMINALHEKLNIPVLEDSAMVEDFKDEAKPAMNKDGFDSPEVHDD